MDYHITKKQSNEVGTWVSKKNLSLGFIVVSYLIFFSLFNNYFRSFITNFDELGDKFTFSVSAAVAALILAGTYFYTYQFFKENFYFYIFIGWVANALYLIPELNGPLPGGPDNGLYINYRIGVLLLSLLSSGFMLLALIDSGGEKVDNSTWLKISIVATICVALDVFVILKLMDSPSILIWMMLIGSAISFFILWGIGENLRIRLDSESRSRKRRIAFTFFVYAFLQFIYPLIPYLEALSKNLLLIPFLIAQVVKVMNAVLMMGVLQSARDKQIEEVNRELADREKKLESQTRLADLGILAASIKHDINTPLATMGSLIDSIKKRFPRNTEVIKVMEKLDQSIARISAIANIVDIIRGNNNFMDRDAFMVKAGMLEIVKNAVELVKREKIPIIGNTAIKIRGREAYVRAFVPMLEQVLVNIIKNGLEAVVEAGQEQGLITIRVNTTKIPNSKYSRWVRVEISDNGCGIPKEHLEKLTTVFTTRSEKKTNSGIGLFTGKRIVTIHKGKISFTSKVGEGTKVTILLPEWEALQKSTQQHAEHDFSEADDAAPGDHDSADDLVAETTYSQTVGRPTKAGEIV